jgi:cytoskeleton protein RodZ
MESFGRHLQRQRELRGIRLEEISRATRISRRFLEYMENDRWDELPGGVFPRAFVRQYASTLGLDVEKTVAEFVFARQASAPPPVTSPKSMDRRSWVVLAVGFLLFAAILIPRLRNPSASSLTPADSTPAMTVSPTPRSREVYSASLTADRNLQMTIEATADCWIEARVDGQVILNRVLIHGEATEIKAAGEIRLSVGNAGGLIFTINDQPGLPLGRDGEVKRDILITRENLPSLVQSGEKSPGSVSS